MSFVPGMGILKGMALTLRRFFAPKVTIRYPEVAPDIAVKYRGRMQLLYDEHGTLKCETCFQCAQACPIECIDMGGSDTKGQYAIHWGASETYGERREEAALRRAGREVPDPTYTRFEAVDTAAVDRILEDYDYDPHRMLSILEAIQAEFGHLPVAALKQVSFTTGSWYAMIYGTATYYRHFQFEKTVEQVAVCRCTACLMQGGGQRVRQSTAALHQAGGAATDGDLFDGLLEPEVAVVRGGAVDHRVPRPGREADLLERRHGQVAELGLDRLQDGEHPVWVVVVVLEDAVHHGGVHGLEVGVGRVRHLATCAPQGRLLAPLAVRLRGAPVDGVAALRVRAAHVDLSLIHI